MAILALAYNEFSPWTALLFFIPALAAQRLLGMYQQQRQLADELKRANMSFAEALVATLKRPYRGALEGGRDLLPRHREAHGAFGRSRGTNVSVRAGPRHRKDRAARSLLLKDGPLTLEERRQMQEHPAIGEAILKKVDLYADVALVVRHRRERIDGEGYPDRIAGDEIPLVSRIIAVADAYNAMTSDRPYRDAMPSRVARLRLAQAVERQFDTAAVAAFEAILTAADEEYRTARRPDFEPNYAEDFGAVANSAAPDRRNSRPRGCLGPPRDQCPLSGAAFARR